MFHYKIHIDFEEEELAPVVVTVDGDKDGNFSFSKKTADSDTPVLEKTYELDPGEGPSLLEVAVITDIHLNHNCGGVCACTTCHLYVNKGEDALEEISDKEEDYVDRAINPRLESRLGCQCLLLEGKGDISITVPDQSIIIGHEH